MRSYESVVFKELVWWMQNKPEHSSLFPKLLKHIDLYLLNAEHLDMLFNPIQLIDHSFYENLLCQPRQVAIMIQKPINCNVINGINDLRIIEGCKHWVDGSDNSYLFASANDTIIIDLKQQFLINCLKLKLRYKTSYTVSVSKDMRDWEQIIDYSKYECSGQQLLYFNERVVRFIRVNKVAMSCLLIEANVEALYSTDSFEIDMVSTLSVPHQNVVPSKMAHTFVSNTGDGFKSGVLLYECIEHLISDKHGIIFQFSQPYIVGSIKLLLNDTSSYFISISTNEKCFTRVLAEENVTGWRVVTFKMQPVMYIKIVGTKAPSLLFQLYKLKCPAV